MSAVLTIQSAKTINPVPGCILDNEDHLGSVDIQLNLFNQNAKNLKDSNKKTIQPTSIVRTSHVLKMTDLEIVQEKIKNVEKIIIQNSKPYLLENTQEISVLEKISKARKKSLDARESLRGLRERETKLIESQTKEMQNIPKLEEPSKIQTKAVQATSADCCCIC